VTTLPPLNLESQLNEGQGQFSLLIRVYGFSTVVGWVGPHRGEVTCEGIQLIASYTSSRASHIQKKFSVQGRQSRVANATPKSAAAKEIS
jgi:hypothetical protein